jgi:hypothetical protein
LTVKQFNTEELFKKCGFKKADDFIKQVEWKLKTEGKKLSISLYGKTKGKANSENKYDFPPPIDTTLFFGSCLLLGALLKDDGKKEPFSLTLEIWEKMYEKLFGGFEDLATTAVEDEAEEDELEGVPANKKTKDGYLKDGFVVDSDSDDKDAEYETDSDDDDEDSDKDEDSEEVEDIGEIVLEDIGSELSEESYSDEEDE